jgi:DNA-binding response OmpR family regulator
MTSRLRILIAADDITAAGTLGTLLRHSSHELRVAPDNKGAVALAKAWAPQVALVDLAMPGVHGVTLAVALRREAAVPVIGALSTWSGPEVDATAAAAGFDFVFCKGDSVQDLMARLERLTG